MASTTTPSAEPALVPVGVTTKVGYSSSLILFVLAVYAFVQGDRSEQTLGTLAAGIAAVLVLLATQAGRYLQAKAQIVATTPGPALLPKLVLPEPVIAEVDPVSGAVVLPEPPLPDADDSVLAATEGGTEPVGPDDGVAGDD